MAAILLAGVFAKTEAVSGRVVTPSSAGVQGITLVLKSSNQSTTTDAQGAFVVGSTGVGEGVAATGCRFLNGTLQIRAAEPTTLRVEVRDAQGALAVPVLDRRLEQGFTTISPLQGMSRKQGILFVRVRLGSQEQVYRAFRANAASEEMTVSGAGREAAATTDTLILRSGTTEIGRVGFVAGAATVSDIAIVRRTIGGSITTNGLSIGSVNLSLVPSSGATLTLAPTCTAGSWTITTGWTLYKSSVTWVGTVKILDASSNVLGTGKRSFADNVETVAFDAISLAAATVPAPPSNLKASIDWVWENRIKDPTEANALGFYNYLFDQIYDEKGSLYVCVRWESKTKVTKEQREKFEPMANRYINNWVMGWLKGYDGWAYDSVKVKIVGWAVIDGSYLDQTGMTVPVYVNGGLEAEQKTAPHCPDACNRDNFHNTGKVSTTYPDCKSPDQHFDITLWGTDDFVGGAGGDWGAREGAGYILGVLDTKEPHIIEHEVGHAFSLPDFYDDNQFPPSGLPVAIMQAGASMVITEWDGWMLRRVWTEMKKAEPTRFK